MMISQVDRTSQCSGAASGRRTDSLRDRDRAGRDAFRFDYKRNDLSKRAHFSLSRARGFCAGAAERIAASGLTTTCLQRTVRVAIDRAINLGTERSHYVTNDLAGGCGLGLMRARSWDLALAAAPPAGKVLRRKGRHSVA